MLLQRSRFILKAPVFDGRSFVFYGSNRVKQTHQSNMQEAVCNSISSSFIFFVRNYWNHWSHRSSIKGIIIADKYHSENRKNLWALVTWKDKNRVCVITSTI